MACDYGAERIGLFIHPACQMMEHALARGATLRSFTGAGFLRLNDLARTLEGMADTLRHRLNASRFAGYPIQLRLMTEEQSAEISFGEPGRKAEVVELAAPATDLIRLLSGWFGLDNLSPGSYALRHQDVLRAFFPKGNPKIAIADLI